MRIIKDTFGSKYKLSTKRISEESGRRYVLLADLKKNLPGYGGSIANEILYMCISAGFLGGEHYVATTWITVGTTGCLSIGCKDFGVTASRAIYKAMGVRRKVQ